MLTLAILPTIVVIVAVVVVVILVVIAATAVNTLIAVILSNDQWNDPQFPASVQFWLTLWIGLIELN